MERPAVLLELERRRREAIRVSFTRLHVPAFGAGVGAVAGLGLATATAWLVAKGSAVDDVGAHLSVLGNVFPGYAVTWPGVAIGLLWGAAAGFVAGVAVAWIRNAALRFVLWKAVADQRRWRRRHLLDEI